MELREVIKRRYSLRRYKSNEVPINILEEIMSLALYSPSASNMRAWNFIIVNEKNKIENIKRFSPGMGFIPPSIVVIGMDTEKALQKGGIIANKEFIYYDAGIVANTIALLALDFGLGSCILASFNKTAVAELVNFPEKIKPLIIVAIGYPLEDHYAKKSQPKDNVVYIQKYTSR